MFNNHRPSLGAVMILEHYSRDYWLIYTGIVVGRVELLGKCKEVNVHTRLEEC